MRRQQTRPVAIVIGSSDIGSAVAVALARVGYAAIVCDRTDPSSARRGMAFTDAWYVGHAELGGVNALFCGTIKAAPTVLERPGQIAATTWSWRGAAGALNATLVVDTRHTQCTDGTDFRIRVPPGLLAVGIGTCHTAVRNVDLVIEAPMADPSPTGLHEPRLAAVRVPASRPPRGICTAVFAKDAGRFRTSHRIGDCVKAGQLVGALDREPVTAPISGVLRGLSARGAWVQAANLIVEVDPRSDPTLCFGLDDRAMSIAHKLLAALADRGIRGQMVR